MLRPELSGSARIKSRRMAASRFSAVKLRHNIVAIQAPYPVGVLSIVEVPQDLTYFVGIAEMLTYILSLLLLTP